MSNRLIKKAEMKELHVPQFKISEEEAAFWDTLDTADFMEEAEEWFRFETPHKGAIRVAILPEIAEELMRRAHTQGVSIETLVNVLLSERIQKPAATS